MQPRFSKDPCAERLRELVAAEVASRGLLNRAYVCLHAKAVAIVLWTLVSYWMLVDCDALVVAGLPALLGAGGYGRGLQHHARWESSSFSRNGRTNRLAGFTLDLLGGSSLFWVDDHNRKHHNAPNVDPFDGDIRYGLIARVAPSQPWRSWYRFQQYYIWFLYAFIPERWQFYLDFRKLLGRQRANSSAPTVDRRQYWLLLAGKLMFMMWALVVPALLHPLWCVALLYLFGAGLAGLILATVLQWAHCVEGAMFLSVQRGQERLPETWLRIQVEATRNVQLPRWLSWYVGGLDHQIEHHLFRAIRTRSTAIWPTRSKSSAGTTASTMAVTKVCGQQCAPTTVGCVKWGDGQSGQRLNMIRLKCIVYRIADGKVAESTAYINWLDMSKSAWST